MSQEFQVTWVGDEPREWQGKHGSFLDYTLKVAGYDDTCKLTQKPETDPPRPGDTIYGHIQVQVVNPSSGEPFEVHKLKKERRPDDAPPHKVRQSQLAPQNGAKGDMDTRSARIERQHSQEMALRMLSAHIAAGGKPPKGELIPPYLKQLTDYFCEDLDEYVNRQLPSHSSSSGQSKGVAEEKAATPKLSQEDAKKIIERCKVLDSTRWQLELIGIADGIDLTKWEEGIHALTPAQASQFEAKLDDITQEKVPAGGISDDDDIPF